MSRLEPWRSMLFVPAYVDRFVRKSLHCGADAIILDLEDSVPASEKANARESIVKSIALMDETSPDVIVRVNRPLAACLDDLAAVVVPGVRAVMLPKVHSAAHVQLVAEVIDDIEVGRGLPRGALGIFPLIESVNAFHAAKEIAKSDARVCGLMLGPEDFAVATGMQPLPETLIYPSQEVLFAARAAGKTPYGCIATVANYGDVEAARKIMRRSYLLGFEGATCIHPSLIAVLNEEYTPTTKEFEHASDVIAAYARCLLEGAGAVALDGEMIDPPVVERARKVIRSYERRRYCQMLCTAI